MSRLTRALGNKGPYAVDDDKVGHGSNGFTGEAVDKLARFENLYEDILNGQDEISKELEKLRLAGQTKSVKFRELMTRKLMNTNFLILLKSYGLYASGSG
jgi:hypothetical protein